MALPMKQIEYSRTTPSVLKEGQAKLYKGRLHSFGGLDFNFMPVATFDHTSNQRKEIYEWLWAKVDFHFWMATYQDMLFDDEANTEAYNFW